MHITVTNVNHALCELLCQMDVCTTLRSYQSRNGPVLVYPTPVLTTYLHPRHRVLFSPQRDANPFLHVMEALWMLAGERTLNWPAQFNRRFHEYSDNGETLHGAYGWRWRNHWDMDQLLLVQAELLCRPSSRRAILQMWDPRADLAQESRDLPCNTAVYFDRREDNLLDMTITCRSNDLLWGATGSNAVHFSLLLEWMSAACNADVGAMHQFSNNLHIYTETYPRTTWARLAMDANIHDGYTRARPPSTPLVSAGESAGVCLREVETFIVDPLSANLTNQFLTTVAQPMYRAWQCYKNEDFKTAIECACKISAWDWSKACLAWLLKRRDKREEKKC